MPPSKLEKGDDKMGVVQNVAWESLHEECMGECMGG